MTHAPDDHNNTPRNVARERVMLARKRRLARITVWAENISAAFWRPLIWCCAFAGLWMLQIPSMFGAAGPGVALAIFLLGLAWFLRHDLHHLRPTTRHAIDRRLEEASALRDRPLEIIDDHLANADTAPARQLWLTQRHRAYDLIAALRWPWPRALLAARDPWGLRFAALLLLVVGLVAAGPQARDRIAHGLTPYEIKFLKANEAYLTLWITPPVYTGQPRLTLQGTGNRDEILSLPAGSVLKARINSRFGQPVLHMGDEALPIEALDSRSWGIELPVEPGTEFRITQWGIPRATIPYELVPDMPPHIAVVAEAKIMDKGELQFSVELRDDYGVTDMTMHMDIDPVVEDRPLGAAVTESRAIMSAPGALLEIKPLYDLSWHPWAGLPVIVTFTARDHLEQETQTETLQMVLPERTFRHPVAAALIAQRKRLAWNYEADAADVSQKLLELMIRPEAYAQDTRVFLSLRTMVSRLQYDQSAETAAAVIAQLWDTAIRIEDGNLPLAARELRAARAELEKLLADPHANADDIAVAMDKLRAAMAEYFRELAREMQKRLADGEMLALPPELFESLTNPEALANFLDQLQSQALTGDRDAARQMLSQLQQLMDNLNPAMGMQMPPQMQFMQEGINELQELIEKQQALLDQTQSYFTEAPPMPPAISEIVPIDPGLFQRWGESGSLPVPPMRTVPPVQRSVNTERHVPEQDALRFVLGKLMLDAGEMMDDIPESMGLAEQEMRASSTQLGANEPTLSAPHQQQAIEYLQDAMQDMSQQMAQMLQQMMMLSLGPNRLDPLGRPMQEGRGPSWLPGSQVEIPDEAERKRVQDIQKKLRDRAGERERPDYELDYFRRLLRQF